MGLSLSYYLARPGLLTTEVSPSSKGPEGNCPPYREGLCPPEASLDGQAASKVLALFKCGVSVPLLLPEATPGWLGTQHRASQQR